IVPTAPETGYGYIQRGVSAAADADTGVYRIARFVEKPSLERAQQFLQSGEYLWNSGMFMFRASRYLEELERFSQPIARASAKAFGSARADLDFVRIDAKTFEQCPSDSIDYAVMEKTSDAVVVPLQAGWSDVGSWSALHAACDTDGHGNVARGDVIAED